jgi:hypothetical protein
MMLWTGQATCDFSDALLSDFKHLPPDLTGEVIGAVIIERNCETHKDVLP